MQKMQKPQATCGFATKRKEKVKKQHKLLRYNFNGQM